MKQLAFILIAVLFAACSKVNEELVMYISLQDEQGTDLIQDLDDDDIQVDSVIWNQQQVTSLNAHNIRLVNGGEAGIETKKVIQFMVATFIPAETFGYLNFEDFPTNQITFYLKIKNEAFSGVPLAFSFDYDTSGRYKNQLNKMTFNKQQCRFETTPIGAISIVTCHIEQ